MLRDIKEYITFDDVLILPDHSNIKSREEVDISSPFLGRTLKLPIISANMDYVTEYDMAIAMLENGGFYVLHRFMDNDLLNQYIRLINKYPNYPVSVSIGIRDSKSELTKVRSIAKFVNRHRMVVTVDVAHGDHTQVIKMIERLKDFDFTVIAGNVATARGFKRLAEAGADAIKVGIGPGAVCTTREVTGVGVPQLSAIMNCVEARDTNWPTNMSNIKIIADGGIKNSGDIVKALAVGADAVMLGSLLAGTNEAPGEVRTDPHGQRWKPYRGQSIFGVNGFKYTPEGVEGFVKEKGPVSDVLRKLAGGIRSGMSYVGARNLAELRENAEFIRVSPGTSLESTTRVQTF